MGKYFLTSDSFTIATGREVLESLWDLGGENHPMITSMREHRGYLYLGGISNNRIGRLKLERCDPAWSGPAAYWGDKA